jgi:hypothetical protein
MNTLGFYRSRLGDGRRFGEELLEKTLGLSGSRLGDGRRVGEELLENTEKRFRVVKRSNIPAVIRGGVEQDASDASLQEGKVHEADAAQVRLMLVLGHDLTESSNYSLRSRSKSHDLLVLRRDGEIVQGKISKVTYISVLMMQALGERSQYIVLSTADHGNTVLLMTDIAKLVNALGGGGDMQHVGAEHSLDKLGDIIETRGLGGSGTKQRERYM